MTKTSIHLVWDFTPYSITVCKKRKPEFHFSSVFFPAGFAGFF
jgi:hypothetical protein